MANKIQKKDRRRQSRENGEFDSASALCNGTDTSKQGGFRFEKTDLLGQVLRRVKSVRERGTSVWWWPAGKSIGVQVGSVKLHACGGIREVVNNFQSAVSSHWP